MQVDTQSLYYAQNRYYNPQIGRFISEDPSGLSGGFNPYAYAHGDPVNFADPLGLSDVFLFGENYTFDSETWGNGMATGAAAVGAAGSDMLSGMANMALEGTTPGMMLNSVGLLPQIPSFYDGGAYKCQEGFGTSKILGRVGLEAGMAAGTMAMEGVNLCLWKGCFTGDTLVLMADGSAKPIADIVPGDKVLSKSDTTGAVEAKTVVDVSVRDVAATLDVNLSDGTTLHTTDEHPFFVDGKGWVKAGDLAQGSSIVTRAGPRTAGTGSKTAEAVDGGVRVVKTAQVEGSKTVHNLLIEDSHTYFVKSNATSAGDWKWVHNGCEELAGKARNLWAMTVEGTSRVMRHPRFGKMYEHASTGHWWSRDTAGHGGSAWKVFKKVGNNLEWEADADVFGDYLLGKHKGPTGFTIPWKELSGSSF